MFGFATANVLTVVLCTGAILLLIFVSVALVLRQHRLEPPACRVCGCTDDDCTDCIRKTGAPCWWVEEDLCSACADLSRVPDHHLPAGERSPGKFFDEDSFVDFLAWPETGKEAC